ncbi:hypothetical protein M426DRAFT_180743 [Hypoxylon sp. CI-4A]|nr:hypothetical protein M426DRAFT_180743 [Hypoxylon sp. CI-4A]
MKLEAGVTLHAFNHRFHKVANHLADLGAEMPAKAKLLLMLNAIKARYPIWHNFVQREFEKGMITWEEFEREIIQMANMEEEEGGDTKDGGALRPAPTAGGKPKRQKTDCKTCKKPRPAGLPHCSGCAKHHQGGEAKCYVLHPELRPVKREAGMQETSQ